VSIRLKTIINCQDNTRLADVVFIHGLGGGWHRSWRAQWSYGQYWPRWLGEDNPQVGVWSLDYAMRPPISLEELGRQALETLSLHGIGARPVIFICHSFGGLLAKQILQEASRPSTNGSCIFYSTKVIFFLSTPHMGVEIELTGPLRQARRFRPTIPIDELAPHNPFLVDLNEWFKVNSAHLRMRAYYENRPIGSAVIVKTANARISMDDIPTEVVNANHISICKLRNRNELIYRDVSEYISLLLCGISPTGIIASPKPLVYAKGLVLSH
jgi:pimeloyl-ACP methyl ester carboxylesterase